MKKLLLFAISFLVVCGAASADDRIVFIDLERVFNNFYKTRLAKSKMEAQNKDAEAERQVMVDEMTAVSEEVDQLRKEARDVTLSEEIRDGKRILYEERLLELREKEQEIVDFAARRKQQSQMQVSRMSQTIMDEIRATVVEYAQKEGLQAVVDTSSRGATIGVFIYTRADVDITETILMILNSKQPELTDEELLEADGGDEAQISDDGGEASENDETE